MKTANCLLLLLACAAVLSCKTTESGTALKSSSAPQPSTEEQIKAWCHAASVVLANDVMENALENAVAPKASGLRLDGGSAADAGERAAGTATIQSPPPGFKCPKQTPRVASKASADGDGDGATLALNGEDRAKGWVIELGSEAIQRIWGAPQWAAVADLPFPKDEICELQEKQVACTAFHVPREDGRCFDRVRPQAAQSLECGYQCARCQDKTGMLADFAGYLKSLDTWVGSVNEAISDPAKRELVKLVVATVKEAAVLICSVSGGSDCANSIKVASTWRKFRGGVKTVAGLTSCASGSAQFTVQMIDYVSRMIGKGEDLGYLNDGAIEGLLKIAATFSDLADSCGDAIPGLKKLMNDPKVKAITLSLQLGTGINERTVCEATRKACMLQFYSYGASVLEARQATKRGIPTQYRPCCLCQMDGNRNIMSVTSSKVDCERNLTWGPNSRRKNCRYMTVEGTSCSLERPIERRDSMHRVVATGTGPNWLQPVNVSGSEVSDAGDAVSPPNPPIFAMEYGFTRFDPDDGTVTYEALDEWKYTVEFMSSVKPMNDFEAFKFCGERGWRVGTLRELLQLRPSIAAMGSDWGVEYWAQEMASEAAWTRRPEWGPFELGWRWGVNAGNGEVKIYSTTSTRNYSSANLHALCVRRAYIGQPVGVCKDATLASGASLNPGEALCSPSGRYNATLQTDGNLVVYDLAKSGDRAIWSSRTSTGAKLTMQGDCNLVLYPEGGSAAWSSGTNGRGEGCYAQMQDDGNFVVYPRGAAAVWSSR